MGAPQKTLTGNRIVLSPMVGSGRRSSARLGFSVMTFTVGRAASQLHASQ